MLIVFKFNDNKEDGALVSPDSQFTKTTGYKYVPNKGSQLSKKIKSLHSQDYEIIEFYVHYAGDCNWLPYSVLKNQSIKPKGKVDENLNWNQIILICRKTGKLE